MTVTVAERITALDAAILRSWLGGNRVQDIAKANRMDAGKVGSTIDRLCNYDRAVAGRILDTGLLEPPAPSVQRPVPKPAAAAPAPAPAAPVEPAPTPEPPVVDPPSQATLTIDELLDRGDRLTSRTRQLAARIRANLDELRQAVHRYEAQDAARQLVAQRRRELDEAEARLRELLTGAPTTPKAKTQATGAASTSRIRAWAQANGVECNPLGVLPTRVIDAYQAAHMEAVSTDG